MENKKSLIVLGAGILVEPLIDKAKSLGIHVIVFEWNLKLEGLKKADAVVQANLKDIDDSVQKAKQTAKKYNVRGVCTCGADLEITVAAIASALALPGIPLTVAERCHDKIATRSRLTEAGLDDVRWARVNNMESALDRAAELGYPCVLKPADNCGSRGVKKVSNDGELKDWFSVAKNFSLGGELFLEEYIEGPRQTVEMIAYGGEIYLVSIIDTHYIYEEPEKYPWGDFPVETGLHPTEQPANIREHLFNYSKQVVRAIGVDFGPVKVDTTITSQGIKTIELTARLSGGFHCQYSSPLSLGTDEIGAVVKMSIGQSLDLADITPKWNRGACVWSKLPPPGRITAISGIEEAKKMPGIKEIFLFKSVGDQIGPYQNSTDRFCFVIGDGRNITEAKENVFKALDKISIEVEQAV